MQVEGVAIDKAGELGFEKLALRIVKEEGVYFEHLFVRQVAPLPVV